MIKEYRKKPVVVEAIQFDGWNWAECYQFMSNEPVFLPQIIKKMDSIQIDTLEGKMTANIGDYIIKGVNGEFYPYKPDIFEKTYEEVKEDK